MTAFAVRYEQSSFVPADIAQLEAEDFAAAQPAKEHRVDHHPITISAKRTNQSVDVVMIKDAGQMPGRAHQRNHPAIAMHR